jgi:hypothetical protein
VGAPDTGLPLPVGLGVEPGSFQSAMGESSRLFCRDFERDTVLPNRAAAPVS